MAKAPHLLNSDTFKVFARPSGDIEKTLNMHAKPSSEFLVEKYKTVLHVDEFPSDA